MPSAPPSALEVLRAVLKEKFTVIDEDTLEYFTSILQDEDAEEEDLVESVSGLLQSAIESEESESIQQAKDIVTGCRPKSTGKFSSSKEDEMKVLSAPVSMAKIAEEQNNQVKDLLRSALRVSLNFNETVAGSGVGGTIFANDEDLSAHFRMAKKAIRKDRKDTRTEERVALERDEIIKRLSNKPVKLHSKGGEINTGQRDIRLENVSMTLASLELLEDVTLTLTDGRKYGLVGKNGIGKTTLLKHLASHSFPGIPGHLQILHIEQEVEGTELSVLHTILATDIERESLIMEAKALQVLMDKEEALLSHPKTEGETAPTTVENGSEATEGKQEEEKEEDVYGHLSMTPLERGQHLSEIFNRMQEIDADSAVARASSILAGLGFTPEMQQSPTKSFSGGWRMRISLAQALFIAPDVLLLDEPTNHLDLHSVFWLEDYLQSWKNTLIIVSHDRDFLNAVPTDILRMHNKTVVRYKGNYDAYEKLLVDQTKTQLKQKEAQEKEVAHMQAFVDKNRANASTAKMAQSRLKKLSKVEVMPEIANDPQFKFSIPQPDLILNALYEVTDVTFGYSMDKILFKNANLNVQPDSRIALVGSNGVGKSTFLKLLLNKHEPLSGMIKTNPKLRIGRFTQHHMDQLDMNKTPLSWFQSMYSEAKHQEIRRHLGGMGIQGNLALQPIYSLSGGQKSRVAFANVTWNKPHLLLLDEPTNHLDMETIDSLIRALNEFTGAVLVVSHDEHLISSVVDTIWVCESQTISEFKGDFDDYKKALQMRMLNTRK